jgi:hypothetical protein
MIQQTVAVRCRFYAGHKEGDIKSHLITASHATPPHQHAAKTSKGLSLFLSLAAESGERGAVFKSYLYKCTAYTTRSFLISSRAALYVRLAQINTGHASSLASF